MSIKLEWTEIFKSVEFVWAIWGCSIIILSVVIRRLTRYAVQASWRDLFADESGAAYTLSYVFSFPIFMLLVCTVIQTSLVLIVKIGTMYACYAGARSAAVWLPAKPDIATEKIKLAVVHAITPFAEGSPVHTQRLGVSLAITSGGVAYHQAYSRYAAGRSHAPIDYLARKYSFAEKATSVSWVPQHPIENQDIKMSITYRMPMHIPGAARILGHPHGIYPISSTAVLQNEGPKREDKFDASRPLGIDYRSLP